MKIGFNRNMLKIIACVTMLIDHIGMIFFPKVILLRIIGRLAFPIFAYFISDGFYYTHNKYKYFSLLLGFAILSQVPLGLVCNNFYHLNILFTFTGSIILMFLINNIQTHKLIIKIISSFMLVVFVIVLIMLNIKGVIEYGLLGVLLPVVLWVLKPYKTVRFVAFFATLFFIGLVNVVGQDLSQFGSYIQFFACLAVPILLLYNNNKGKLNIKYLFYIFYPLHLIILYLIKVLI